MPRDATDTRERLLKAAEELFARQGVHQATMRDITAAAGQRNASALTYHFGSRSGVLTAILSRHGSPLDQERIALVNEPIAAEATRALLAALLLPYAGCLHTQSGRNYVRIVDQLTDQFPLWRVESDMSPPALRQILAELEHRCDVPEPIARQRMVAIIMLMTTMIAERARIIDEGTAPELDHDAFVANLADMLAGCLHAPVGPHLP